MRIGFRGRFARSHSGPHGRGRVLHHRRRGPRPSGGGLAELLRLFGKFRDLLLPEVQVFRGQRIVICRAVFGVFCHTLNYSSRLIVRPMRPDLQRRTRPQILSFFRYNRPI